MILWTIAIAPLVCGGLLWTAGDTIGMSGTGRRKLLAAGGTGTMLGMLILCWIAAAGHARSEIWWGANLTLSLEMVAMAKPVIFMIPLIAVAIVLWAAFTEEEEGLARLVGLLVAFTGIMELLVLAADLLVVAIAWELLSLLSWLLIAHEWRQVKKAAAANYAFNATRLGGLGLWFAAGATLAVEGSIDLRALEATASSGAWGNWMAFGILAAAASKSAQGPFAYWLFRAMEGPSSVSAFLHSSTMVAAGAWLIIRLHKPLAAVPWFGEAAIFLGLATALAGSVTAIRQRGAKRLLAASTSAQYGLMFTAVGAGYAAAGLTHLLTHAFAKALLFLAAGSAIHAVGSHSLASMRLGRQMPVVAAASWVGAFSLAALPPLGTAWSKEMIISAASHHTLWLGFIVMLAGVLGAWYAMRFQTLAYGRGEKNAPRQTDAPVAAALWLLGALCLALSLLWIFGGSTAITSLLPGELPKMKTWELILSLSAVLAAALLAWLRYRRHRPKEYDPDQPGVRIAEWWGLPQLLDWTMIRPTQALASSCAAFDRRVVDGGVRLAAALARFLSRCVMRVVEGGVDRFIHAGADTWMSAAVHFRNRLEAAVDAVVDGIGKITGDAGSRSRTTQDGTVPTYLAYLVGGFCILLLTLIIGIY